MASLLLAAFALLSTALAQAPTGKQPASTTGSSSFPTITDTENTGALEGTSHGNGPIAGADGSDHGAFKMSTGALIGIVVAVAIIVIAFIVLWALWFIAKRRDWAFRDTVKYASRRLTGRKSVAPTPRTATFPRTPGMPKEGPPKNRIGSVFGSSRGDVEAGTAVPKKGAKPSKSAMKPNPGWLDDEKESSRSRTPEGRN